MSSTAWIAELDRQMPDDVARLLITVPEWFAQTESNEEYIEAARSKETWTVRNSRCHADRSPLSACRRGASHRRRPISARDRRRHGNAQGRRRRCGSPWGTAVAFLEGLAGMFAATETNTVRLRLASEDDVVTWSELRIGDKAPMQVANWTHVEDGRIVAVRVTFDPRPIFA